MLSQTGHKHPYVTIVEPVTAGASWTGGAGFTDGTQELCTPALRDIGFPYSDPLPSDVDIRMLAYSWPAYLIERQAEYTYSDWVSAGCGRPTHSEFAKYLSWCLQKAEKSAAVEVRPGSAVQIDHDEGSREWIVHCEGTDGSSSPFEIRSEGLVVTGIKKKKLNLLEGTPGPLLFTGVDYWNKENLSSISDLYEARTSDSGDCDLSGIVIGRWWNRSSCRSLPMQDLSAR